MLTEGLTDTFVVFGSIFCLVIALMPAMLRLADAEVLGEFQVKQASRMWKFVKGKIR
jgi:hypothetical protein